MDLDPRTIFGSGLKLAERVLAPTGSSLVLAEWTAQGSTGETPLYQAPLHAHPEDEAWYVVEGSLCIRVGDDHSEIGPGGAVVVPGSRRIENERGREWGLSLYAPVIVKYRDEKTDRAVKLEDYLR